MGPFVLSSDRVSKIFYLFCPLNLLCVLHDPFASGSHSAVSRTQYTVSEAVCNRMHNAYQKAVNKGAMLTRKRLAKALCLPESG